MIDGHVVGLVAVVMIFSIPILSIISEMFEKRTRTPQPGLSKEEREQLQQLTMMAKQMNSRIETLENILDAEVPQWREDHEH